MRAFDELLAKEIDVPSHVIEITESLEETRCYWPKTHFYPLLPKMYVPTHLIQALWLTGVRYVASGGEWRYKIPSPFDDIDSPWTLINQVPQTMAGKIIRYAPGPGEDREYVYVVTDDIIKRDGVDNDLQRIVWRD